jgi:DNA-binding NarL/FixJ family response regulator
MSAGLASWSQPTDLMRESIVCTPAAPLPAGVAERVWRELALGRWLVLSAMDLAASRYATLAPVESPAALDWRRLSDREQSVVSWAARGFCQKVVALELGLAKSTVSKALRSARERMGFASSVQLLRAWRAAAGSTCWQAIDCK